MLTLGVVIVALLAIGVLVVLVSRVLADPLHAALWRADEEVRAEQEKARRAMNEAVGQSWRNLIDGKP